MQLTHLSNSSKQHQWLRLAFAGVALAVVIAFVGRAWANPDTGDVWSPTDAGAPAGSATASTSNKNADPARTPSGASTAGSAGNSGGNRNAETQRTPANSDNAKIIILPDDKTPWQAQYNQVKFTVTGTNFQNSDHVKVRMCWKCEEQRWRPPPKDGEDDGRNKPPCAHCWPSWPDKPMPATLVGETDDKSGQIFAVTVPMGWYQGLRTSGVQKTFFGVVPVAELQVTVTDPTAPSVTARALFDIGISSIWLALVAAVLFVVLVGVALKRIAECLKVPGTGWFLPIISSAKGWASLAQLQIILWTIIVGAGAFYVMTLTGSLIDISIGTLSLLGIAGAAVMGSKLKSNQPTQPVAASPPGPISALAALAPSAPVSKDAQVHLTWQPPTVGGAVSAYSVQWRLIGDPCWQTDTTTIITPGYLVVNLEPGNNYEVQVFATNGAGTGAPVLGRFTAPTKHVLPSGAPASVGGFQRTNRDPTGDAIYLDLIGNQDAGVTYTLEYRVHDSNDDWLLCQTNIKADPGVPKTITVSGLRASTDYDFRVCATNSAGDGPPTIVRRVPTGPSGPRVPRWSDLVTDTDLAPEIDVSRLQMLCFTGISAAFVTFHIIGNGTIPEIPATYVTLMGISNGLYLGAKFIGR